MELLLRYFSLLVSSQLVEYGHSHADVVVSFNNAGSGIILLRQDNISRKYFNFMEINKNKK